MSVLIHLNSFDKVGVKKTPYNRHPRPTTHTYILKARVCREIPIGFSCLLEACADPSQTSINWTRRKHPLYNRENLKISESFSVEKYQFQLFLSYTLSSFGHRGNTIFNTQNPKLLIIPVEKYEI